MDETTLEAIALLNEAANEMFTAAREGRGVTLNVGQTACLAGALLAMTRCVTQINEVGMN